MCRPAALLANDLESPACGLVPALVETLGQLRRSGALAALVSSSGPTTFRVYGSEAEASDVSAELRHEGLDARETVAGDPST